MDVACVSSRVGRGPVLGILILPGAAGIQSLAGMLGRAEGRSLLGKMRHTCVQAHTGSDSWLLQGLYRVGPSGTLLLPVL